MLLLLFPLVTFATDAIVDKRRIDTNSHFVRPLMRDQETETYKATMQRLEGKAICNNAGVDNGIWNGLGFLEDFETLRCKFLENQAGTIGQFLTEFLDMHPNMESALQILVNSVLFRVLGLPDSLKGLKESNKPACNFLIFAKRELIIKFAVEDLKKTSPWEEWKNLTPLEECEEVAKIKGDETYNYIAQIFQVQLEHLGVEKAQIKLLLSRIPVIVDRYNLSKEDAMKAVSKLGLYLYTAPKEEGGPYEKLNIALASDDPKAFDNLAHVIGFVALGFQNLHKYDEFRYNSKKPVWRGMKYMTKEQYDSFKEGETFRWPQFVSTSEDKSVALKFAREDFEKDTQPSKDSVIFEITLGQSSLAVDLDSFSHYAGEEKEILLYPYQQFQVRKKIRDACFRSWGIIQINSEIIDMAKLQRSAPKFEASCCPPLNDLLKKIC